MENKKTYMSEENLIKKAKDGDKDAMKDLYKANFKSLYIFIRHKVDTHERAEDICSEAFIKSFEKISTFKENSSYKSWLYTIAKNLVYDWYAKKGKEITAEEDAIDEVGSLKHEVGNNSDNLNLVRRILNQLQDNYREVLELRFLSNFNIKETAEAMEITEGNVKVLQNRALSKAREISKGQGTDLSQL